MTVHDTHDEPRRHGAEAGATGSAEVDAVVESLSQLDGLPVSEHAAVYEAAHERLRSTLAGAGNSPADGNS